MVRNASSREQANYSTETTSRQERDKMVTQRALHPRDCPGLGIEEGALESQS
jgi:hypothetical protein